MPRKKSETDNLPKSRKPREKGSVKAENIPAGKVEQQPQCHIHDKVGIWDGGDIRERVCINDEPLTIFEGKHYCLFHLPTKDKDVNKFEEKFRASLKKVEKRIVAPEDEQVKTNRRISYDFRYVWFPSDVNLRKYKFSAVADFRSAIFTSIADFGSATFTSLANFSEATFTSKADYSEATFISEGNFREATFTSLANFSEATFTSKADFIWATFISGADFRSAKFLETSQVFFREVEFCKTIGFNYAVFVGYVAFEGDKYVDVFRDKEGNREAILDLQNARLEKPERISFHRVRLCPSWFINTDSRKMVFTDIRWSNLDIKFFNKNIKTELENLKKRGIDAPHSLLEIACRQLAANAEENNRYDEASGFRKMANESKRLENYGFKMWNLHWWYWLSSFYGESWQRAFVVLLIILVIFGYMYHQMTFQVCPVNKAITQSLSENLCTERRLNPDEAITQSLAVATFQNVEHRKPLTVSDERLIILEKILAPLQAALLALAIRRKFMR